jgi:hypothetical protein
MTHRPSVSLVSLAVCGIILMATVQSQDSTQRTGDRELEQLARASLVFPEERQLFTDAAATAWAYVDRHYRSSTGLVEPTSGYPYATVWDIASGLSAMYAAHELKLLTTADYDRRVSKALTTLQNAELFDGGGFNKLYSTRTGKVVGTDGRATSRGFGWSALDIGRLLVWLKIVAETQPQHLDRLVSGGYLHGEDLDQAGAVRRYQEGRIGYEQYAARGFALWGASPTRALRLHENSIPITVMDLPLPGDVRGGDRITSDPLVLMGLELGWDMETEQFALQFLRVQEARYRKTGVVTLTGEDAVNVAPHFFYYYCAYTNGKAFGVDVQDHRAVVDGPRWISAKAAFAWHVLRPSAYTELTMRSVSGARGRAGWDSGVYEGSHAPTGAPNINTAAVILTAALVQAHGGPVLQNQSR